MPDLLIELFSEEIPARMQARAADDLKRLMTDGLVEAGLTYASAGAFATPRRLAVSVEGLLPESPALREERRGPRTDAPDKAIEGFLRSTGLTRDDLSVKDDKKGQVYIATIDTPGRPAAEIVAEVLERTVRNFPWPKSMRWGAGSLRWVRPLHSILAILTDEAGASIVPVEIDGIAAGDTTRGHRMMAPDAFAVTSFDDYAAKLKRAKVVLSAKERADHIWADATSAAFAQGLEVVEDAGLLAEVAGLVEWPVVLMGPIGADFLDLPPEVLQTSMREHQKFFSVRNPRTGRIEKFVTVANVETADDGATILAGNEKVLAARLSDAKFFWENDLRTVEREGMKAWTDQLANVTFHAKLGSQAERIDRIAALAREIAPMVGAKPDLAEEAARIAKADLASEMVYEFPELQGVMGTYYARAAGHDDGVPEACAEHYSPLGPSDAVPTAPVSVAVALADKIDTLTGFWAIDEKPTGSKDPYALRRAALGVIRIVLQNAYHLSFHQLTMAALETLLSRQDYAPFESLGAALAGFADPEFQKGSLRDFLETKMLIDFASREKGAIEKSVEALIAGIEKIISSDFHSAERKGAENECSVLTRRVEDELPLMNQLLYRYRWIPKAERDGDAIHAQELAEDRRLIEDKLNEVIADLLSFIHDRLKVHLRDEGIRHDVIDAVLAMQGNDDLTLVVSRARALQAVLDTDDGENLVQGFRRAHNILTQAQEKDGVEYSFGPDPKLAAGAEEQALFAALDTAEADIARAMQAEDYTAAMQAMAALRAPIDAFFEAVQINTDNQILRRNRLNLLDRVGKITGQAADLTRLQG